MFHCRSQSIICQLLVRCHVWNNADNFLLLRNPDISRSNLKKIYSQSATKLKYCIRIKKKKEEKYSSAWLYKHVETFSFLWTVIPSSLANVLVQHLNKNTQAQDKLLLKEINSHFAFEKTFTAIKERCKNTYFEYYSKATMSRRSVLSTQRCLH